jgi:hypothetical protein
MSKIKIKIKRERKKERKVQIIKFGAVSIHADECDCFWPLH